MKSSSIAEKLKENLDEAEWDWIKPHTQRDAVIVVHETMDLVEVGLAIAENRHDKVQEWVGKGILTKPMANQIEIWDRAPSKRFLTLIVQPFVLIQELNKATVH